jgi:hypothetical protein
MSTVEVDMTGGDAGPAPAALPDAPAPPAGARPRRRLGRPLGPVPRVGARAFLGLDRIDLLWLVVLVLGSFAIRFTGPLFPDVLSHPLSGSPVSFWGLGSPYNPGECASIPVDAQGKLLPATTRTQAAAGGSASTVPTQDQQHCGFVVDELYFTVDAADDLHQPAVPYFDPEPPLAKLLMAPAIDWLGFGTWSWRITTTICGSLFVGLVYLIARRLREERFFAVAAATFVALDGMAIVESRIGVIDMIAILWAALAIYAFLLHWGARTRTQWRATLYLFAAVLGLAFGAKLTAIAPAVLAVALIGARLLEPWLLKVLRRTPREGGPGAGEAQMWRDAAGRRPLLHYGAALALVGLMFVGTYSRYLTVPHTISNFAACTQDGGLTTDPSHPSTVYLNPDLGRGGPLQFVSDALRDVYGHVDASLTYHSTECRDHPYASRWYTWPVQAHPFLMSVDTAHTDAQGQAETGYITNLGNPAVWWLSIPALLFCVVAMTRGRSWRARLIPLALLSTSLALMVIAFHAAEQPPSAKSVLVHPSPAFSAGVAGMIVFGATATWCAVVLRRFVPAFIVIGYGAAWLMWALGNERRVLFSYHMLGALLFAALALAYALCALRATTVRLGGVELSLKPLSWAAIGLVVAAFVFFYPIWTGAPLLPADFDMRMWFPSWIEGWQS